MADQVKDPFNADVGDKELTKFPLLQPDRILRFEIRKPVKAAAKKAGSKSEVLTVPCHTTDDQVATDGKTLNKGFPVFMRITVTPSERRDARTIAGDIGRLCQACGVHGVKVIDVINSPAQYLDGKLFDGKVRILPESDGFPESNAISPITPAS